MAEILGASLFALSGALLIMLGLTRWSRAAPPPAVEAAPGPAVLLFEGESLVGASEAAAPLLRGRGAGGSDLAAFLRTLARGFGPDLPERVEALPGSGRLLLAAEGGEGSLEAERNGGSLRLTLRLDESESATLERLSQAAALEELALLRGLAEDAPQPIWIEDASGALTWANRAYLELADLRPQAESRRRRRRRAFWPLSPLFDPPADLAEGAIQNRRLPLERPGRSGPAWFDVTSVRRGGGTLHFATEVSGLVLAETARSHFVQALTRTFADLATGLAVFDRQRRLAVFNPAFLNLTGLPAEILSARPSVQEVLDHLREAQVLPEPRNYPAWRDELAALEARANEGTYCDVWTLPTGRSLRVTGRPHPDGALALLFEDISDALDGTRRLRAELGTLRAAIDALDGAVVVFGPGGAALLSNAAYAELWGVPPSPEAGLAGETGRWRLACEPSPVWDELDRAIAARAPWTGEARHRDGRPLRLRAAALPGAATLISFTPIAPGAEPAAAVRTDRRRPAARRSQVGTTGA